MTLLSVDIEEGEVSEEDMERIEGDESTYIQDRFPDPFNVSKPDY